MDVAAATHCSMVVADADSAHFSPMLSIDWAKSSRSSVVMMVSMGVPRTLTPRPANSSLSLMPTESAVCPPKVT